MGVDVAQQPCTYTRFLPVFCFFRSSHVWDYLAGALVGLPSPDALGRPNCSPNPCFCPVAILAQASLAEVDQLLSKAQLLPPRFRHFPSHAGQFREGAPFHRHLRPRRQRQEHDHGPLDLRARWSARARAREAQGGGRAPREGQLCVRILHGSSEGGARARCDHCLHHQRVLHREVALHDHRCSWASRLYQEHDHRCVAGGRRLDHGARGR